MDPAAAAIVALAALCTLARAFRAAGMTNETSAFVDMCRRYVTRKMTGRID